MKEDTTPIDPTWMSKTGGFARDMTLRDEFAGRAMQIYMANQELIAVYSHLRKDAKREIAGTAYILMDVRLVYLVIGRQG